MEPRLGATGREGLLAVHPQDTMGVGGRVTLLVTSLTPGGGIRGSGLGAGGLSYLHPDHGVDEKQHHDQEGHIG